MVFAEAPKFPRVWLLKPDLKMARHDAEQGTNAHSVSKFVDGF
ncbi:hypothetical protein [Listeria grandensis]|nr:hypothetical protein [Listeria grandensis]